MKSKFALAGRFVRFAIEDGYKIKGFYFESSGEEILIKLPKRLRFYCADLLIPGAMLQVIGTKKEKHKENRVKYTAEDIVSFASLEQQDYRSINALPLPMTASSERTDRNKNHVSPKAELIRVCQKSSCCKRGGDTVWAALETEIDARNLGDRVKLKGTGCMDKCKAGPNIIMPGKMRYSRVTAKAIPGLLEEHFTQMADRSS